jgi:hypothetical protein
MPTNVSAPISIKASTAGVAVKRSRARNRGGYRDGRLGGAIASRGVGGPLAERARKVAAPVEPVVGVLGQGDRHDLVEHRQVRSPIAELRRFCFEVLTDDRDRV